MNYLEGISLKAIILGFVGGYLVPYIFLKGLFYFLASVGINELFGNISIILILLITVIAPIASGYLGAKYSNTLPIMNGVMATALGVVAFFTLGQIASDFVYVIVVVLAIIFGYVGANRYIKYG